MASSSSSVTLYSNNGLGYTLTASFNENSTNIYSNTSNITVTATLSSGAYNWNSSYSSTLAIYWHDNRENYDRFVASINVTTIGRNSSISASGTIDVTHHNDGTLSGYAYATWTKGGTSSYCPNSGAVNNDWTALTRIDRFPILNYGSNFNDEGNPVYNITSYNTFPLRIKLEAGGNAQLIIRDVPAWTNGNYTLQLTEAERNTLRGLCTNSNYLGVRETVCAMSGNTELSANFKDYTMNIVNANPVFSDFEFEDISTRTLALTGNNKANVNGYSMIQATVPEISKAEALKRATMVKYRFSIGDKSKDFNYSSENDVSAIIQEASSGTYNIYAIDSRNNSTLVTKLTSQEIKYQKPYIDKQSTTILRDNNQVGENATLNLKGTFWNDNFGLVNNSLSISYKLKKTTETEWADGRTIIQPTIRDNEFTFDGMIASNNSNGKWDVDSSYNIKIIITDELETIEYELILNSGIPTMSLDKNGIGVMCAFDSSRGGYLQINGKTLEEYIREIINGG